jgi:hypothetical protein
MAKKKAIGTEDENELIEGESNDNSEASNEETATEETNSETEIKPRNIIMANESKLNIFDSENSKFNLTLKTGKKALWTMAEAMQPQNFKQLSEKTQKMFTEGKAKTTRDIIEQM